MDTVLNKFRTQHPDCVVESVDVDMGGNTSALSFTCEVILVASDGWETDNALAQHSQNHIVTNVYPRDLDSTTSDQSPRVTVDVYLLSPEFAVHVYLRPDPDKTTTPTEGSTFCEVSLETCTKIGQVVLSSTVCTAQNSRALGDYLKRMYKVDLTLQEHGRIHDTSHRGIDLTFNVCRTRPKFLTRRAHAQNEAILKSTCQLRLHSLLTEVRRLDAKRTED
jgi:hypothetical protein